MSIEGKLHCKSKATKRAIATGARLNTKICPCNKQRFCSFKIEIFQLKNFDIVLIFAQNIERGYILEPPYRGGSNEYPQSMFWSKNKKKRYTLCKSHFFYIKADFRGYSFHKYDFLLRKHAHAKYEAVLTSTNNLSFGSKVRKKVYPCKAKFYYINMGNE